MKAQINSSKFSSSTLLALLLIATSVSLGCGGGGGGDGDTISAGFAEVKGRAVRPSDGTLGSTAVPLANSPVILRDFVRDSATGRTTLRTQQVGTTDADGNYTVSVEVQTVAAVIIQEAVDASTQVRIAGLFNPNRVSVSKNLDGITDVACEAALSAIDDGSINDTDVDSRRIANLEAGADQVLRANAVNFFNAAQVTAASRQVRDLTDNGRNAPPASDGTPTNDCTSGTFRCGDGTEICLELVCNNTQNCADNSDEVPGICEVEENCCEATLGCVSETSLQCAETCCCCPIDSVCDRNNFENGCTSSARTGNPDANDPLSKLILDGTYF